MFYFEQYTNHRRVWHNGIFVGLIHSRYIENTKDEHGVYENRQRYRCLFRGVASFDSSAMTTECLSAEEVAEMIVVLHKNRHQELAKNHG